MALGKNISPGQGEKYYRKDDYYLQREGGQEHRLEWDGTLASELGLSGKASPEDWKNALHGRLPCGIEINGGTFLDEKGEPQRRAGTDFEFSAPKSVSIQALVHGDDRLIEAHRKAVEAGMAFLEEKVGVRKRKGKDVKGKEVRNFHETGNALIGRVTHFTSRVGDPHLHDHAVFLNVTRNADGIYQAMTNDRMLQYQRLAQEIYHAELARILERMGYSLETGKYGELQIKGYTRGQIEHFSGRAAQIEAYIKDKWAIEWSKLSREERNEKRHLREEAWERTRKAKKVHEIEGLQEGWKEEARSVGAEKVIPGKEAGSLSPEKRLAVARESLKFAVEHHTERESAVKEGELIRTVLQEGRGKIGIKDLKKVLWEAKSSGELIRQPDTLAGAKQNLMTSRESMDREKRILRMEKAGRGAVEPILNPFQAEAKLQEVQEKEKISLNAEQKTAARLILTSSNRYVGINGYAGVGKTTMLKPAVEALKEAGYMVIGLGPQHSTVHALEESGIIESRTLQSWLADRKAREALSPGMVLIIDEAGLASIKNIESTMKRIEKAGARAVFVGDVKQYESVEAGPAFWALQKNGMETVFVTEMQRQNKAAENVREAAKASVSDPTKALELLEQNITEIRDPGERFKALADEYLKSTDWRDTLVLTGTHEARRAVNEHVRKSWGLVGRGTEYMVFRAEDRTVAELKKIGTYEPGQEIRFGKNYRSLGLEAGEVGTIREVYREKGQIRIEIDGRTLDFEPNRLSGKGWEIGRTERIELTGLSVQGGGDRIRITGNSLKEQGITNGMRGEVLESSKNRIMIRFDKGREAFIPIGKKPLEIDHGYAQTGHSAQGLGAMTVILDLPSGSQTLNRRSFYTNLTRTKGKVIAFTDDRERLTAGVTREKDKTMALDVEKVQKREQAQKSFERYPNRGIEMGM